MKKIFLHIAIVIFMSSLLLVLCSQQRLVKGALPAPDEHFPVIEQPGEKLHEQRVTGKGCSIHNV
jgi:hypothetical protein